MQIVRWAIRWQKKRKSYLYGRFHAVDYANKTYCGATIKALGLHTGTGVTCARCAQLAELDRLQAERERHQA